MAFTISSDGTALEQSTTTAAGTDLIGMANVVTTASGTIIDTSYYASVKVSGDFTLDRTLIVNVLNVPLSSSNIYLGTDTSLNVTSPANLMILSGATSAITPLSSGFGFYITNSVVDFVNGGLGGYYNGGYVYNLTEATIIGKINGGSQIGVIAGSFLRNSRYINMGSVEFFGNPSNTEGFVIDGYTSRGAFTTQNLGIDLTKFSSPRYVTQQQGKYNLLDCKVTEFLAYRFGQNASFTSYFKFLKSIKTIAYGANAGVNTTRYVFDNNGGVLASTNLLANGTLNEEVQWGEVDATALGPNTNMNTLANKMTPAMINTNTGTYTHATGEYKLPLSVAHISYEALPALRNNITFDVSSDEILLDYTLQPNLSDDSSTTVSKSVAAAYTSISTAQQLYDRAKAYWADNYTLGLALFVTRSGNATNAGAYNVNIDATAGVAFAISGNTMTIKASTFVGDMVTTGVITLLNGATFDGTRTDANGTVSPPITYLLQLPNILVGSRFQIYNETSGSELTNALTVSGGVNNTYTKGTDYTAGDVGRYRVTYQNGAAAKEFIEGTFTFPSASAVNSLPIVQVDDAVYIANAIDGSTLASLFSADFVNNEIDILTVTDFNGVQLYAYFVYVTTTAAGISGFAGGFTAVDQANYRVNVSILNAYLNNNTATNIVQLDNVRIYRTDGAYPVRNPTTGGGGIDVVWRDKIFIAETGVSGLTPAESAKLSNIETTTKEVHELTGLLPGKPATFTPSGISTSAIGVTITGDGVTSTIVTRNA